MFLEKRVTQHITPLRATQIADSPAQTIRLLHRGVQDVSCKSRGCRTDVAFERSVWQFFGWKLMGTRNHKKNFSPSIKTRKAVAVLLGANSYGERIHVTSK